MKQTKFSKTGIVVFIQVCFLWLAAVSLFAQEEPPDPPPASPQREPLEGMINLSLEAGLFSGEAASVLTIDLPQSAGDIQKALDLELCYRSGASNGWTGKGWELSAGFIAKSCKFGVNNPANPYTLTLNGASYELVSVGGNQYRTKMESNTRIEFDGSIWRVWDRGGTEYKFDLFIAGQWFLTKITNSHGITLSIEYDKPNSEEIYLKEIRYPEGQGLSPYCKISFSSEDREDKLVLYSYGAPFKVNRRLNEIQILADGQVQKKYRLTYKTNGVTKTSLLSSIIQYGKDGASLPAVSFSYQPPLSNDPSNEKPQLTIADSGELFTHHTGNYSFQDIRGRGAEVPAGLDVALVDLNADGLDDFIGCKYIRCVSNDDKQFETEWIVKLNTKNGFSAPVIWLQKENSWFLQGKYKAITLTKNSALADMNSDGLPDLVYNQYDNVNKQFNIMVRFNTGAKFSDTETKWLENAKYSYTVTGGTRSDLFKLGSKAAIVDVNADGKGDLLYYRYAGLEPAYSFGFSFTYHPVYDWVVRYNTGSGFSTEEKVYLASDKAFFKYQLQPLRPDIYQLELIRLGMNAALADMNNDGLLDLVYNDYAGYVYAKPNNNYPEPYYNWKVRYNTGEKFSDEAVTLFANAPIYIYNSDASCSGFSCDGNPYFKSAVRIGENGELADVNNDGLPDLVYNEYKDGREIDGIVYAQTSWYVMYNDGNKLSSSQLLFPALGYIYGNIVTKADLSALGVDGEALFANLVKNGYINSEGLIQDKFKNLKNYTYMIVDAVYKDKKLRIYEVLRATIQETCYANIVTNNSAIADINGDGKMELVYPKFGATQAVSNIKMAGLGWEALKASNSFVTDLLTEQTNVYGGKTTISYASSADFSSQNLPFIMPVVKTVVNNPGMGDSGTTVYSYEGGLYNCADREFKGFRHVSVTDPLNYVRHTYFFQDDSRLGKIEKEENSIIKTVYTYHEDNASPYATYLKQLDEYADSQCKRTVYEYDGYGNIIKEINYGDINTEGDEKTVVTDYAVNASSWLVNLPAREQIFAGTQAAGTPLAENRYLYDYNSDYTGAPSQGDLTSVKSYLDIKNKYITTSAVYDKYGNEIERTDEKGYKTVTAYDSVYHMFPVTVTNPAGHIQSIGYHMPGDSKGLFGQVKQEINPNGNKTGFEYDGFGRKTKITNPYDESSSYGSQAYEYGLNGPGSNYVLTRITEESATANHLIKVDILDGAGRVVQTTQESETPDVYNYKTLLYNGRGEIKSMSLPYFKDGGLRTCYLSPDSSVKWTTFDYDNIGRVTKLVKPDNTSTVNAYNGWVTTVTDENNHRKIFTNDAYARLVKVEEKNKENSEGKTYVTRYQFDAVGNLRKIIDDKNNETVFGYDTLERKISLDDPDLGKLVYEYDDAGNLEKQVNAKGDTIVFGYDNIHRLITKNYAAVQPAAIKYNYDEQTSANGIGQRTSMEDSSGSSRWYYDKRGRVVKLEKTIDGQTYTVEWGYDAMDRIKSIIYPNGKQVNFQHNNAGYLETIDGYCLNTGYNASGQITELNLPNSLSTVFDYYPENLQLKSIKTPSVQDLGYEYDNIGNIKKITDNVRSSVKEYSYDDLDRLINAQGNVYKYDSLGNIIEKDGAVWNYSQKHPHAIDSDGVNQYHYDDNGNMISGAGRTILYDSENRPVKITKDTVITEFVYDGDGRRVKKTVSDGSSSKTTVYIEDLYEKELTE